MNNPSSGDQSGIRFIFRSLKSRNYRLFYGGQSISLIGTWIQRLAVPWLVYRLTDSAFLLGVVGFAGQIPTFILAPFAGVLVDRWDRRRILLWTQILAMIQATVLTILYFTDTIQIWIIILLGVFLGLINAFDMPARQSFLVQMVDQREDLSNAIALNSSMVNSARLLGPSIAGILIAVTGEGICFLLNALSYIVVIGSLVMIRTLPPEVKNKNEKVFDELKEGIIYVFGFTPIRSIILLVALISLMGMPYTVLTPVFAKEIFHGGAHTFGFLMAAAGVGALTASLYLASRKSVIGLGRIIPISAALFGAGLIAFAWSRIFLLSLLFMLVAGFGMIMTMASSNTILQTITDDDKRGRVMSFFTIAFMGTAPFGSLLAGSLASQIGAPNTLLLGGVTCIIGAAIFWSKLSEIRKLIRPIYQRMGIVPEVTAAINKATQLTTPPED
jgi:MFS family permease